MSPQEVYNYIEKSFKDTGCVIKLLGNWESGRLELRVHQSAFPITANLFSLEYLLYFVNRITKRKKNLDIHEKQMIEILTGVIRKIKIHNIIDERLT
jgi:hypothetical protein